MNIISCVLWYTFGKYTYSLAMSFLQPSKNTIEFGDTVFVYISHKQIVPIILKRGQTFNHKYGAFKHNEVAGLKYGCKINCTRGYVYLLKATPELWTVSLPHRTQIVYYPDISMATTQLGLSPGSFVAEAGTGSGSVTHSFARTVAPHGHVYTFDFHEQRAKEAEIEFKTHGLSSVVTSGHRDICAQGFPIELNGKLDAIFLDLPSPSLCIGKVKNSLKINGRICCFSPCIEQVQKSIKELQANKFLDIETLECLLRPYEMPKSVKIQEFDLNGDSLTTKEKDTIVCYPSVQMAGHTGFLTFATRYI